jgi:glutamine amidotransferase
MIAIVNYGSGNLHSVRKAVEFVGGVTIVTEDAQSILGADKVILPGVGAFADAMLGLESRGLVKVIHKVVNLSKPLLGICLGMQVLFEKGKEQGYHTGLGLLPGEVIAFPNQQIKVPQIGWNNINVIKPSRLMAGLRNGDYFYFNHGYYCLPANQADVLTETQYGVTFASSVETGNIFGVQFHPEKSQKRGLQILRNFVEL